MMWARGVSAFGAVGYPGVSSQDYAGVGVRTVSGFGLTAALPATVLLISLAYRFLSASVFFLFPHAHTRYACIKIISQLAKVRFLVIL